MFGDRLQELRLDIDLTQEQLAEKFNTSRAVISKYETGENEPNFSFLIKCSDFFNVSIDYLLCKTKVRTPQDTLYKLNKFSPETLKKLNYIFLKFNGNEKYIDFVHSIVVASENYLK